VPQPGPWARWRGAWSRPVVGHATRAASSRRWRRGRQRRRGADRRFAEPRIHRAYVNNGGDIALHLAPGASFDIGLFTDPAHGLAGLPLDGRFAIAAASPVRGIATSGWRGRSFSLGVADAVTVLATSASRADAAATVIANAVDVDDPRIVRRPADTVRDDSDLGDRLVTCAVPPLPDALVAQALPTVRAAANEIAAGLIVAALLCLQGRAEACGANPLPQETCP
jgi:ApbE superfamily uncharacterized protein (UPF0280 family)